MAKNISQGIYKITNTETQKIYIGSTVNLKKRRKQHFTDLRSNNHSNEHLQRSFNKYGESCFIFEILEECVDFSMKELKDKEQEYLDSIDNWENCYNIEKSVAFFRPLPPTKEKTREKFSAMRKGELNPNFGNRFSEEAKQKLAEDSKVSGSCVRESSQGNWRASIKLEGKYKNLGTYSEKSTAISARLAAEQYYWHGKEEYLVVLENLQKESRKLSRVQKPSSGVYPSKSGRYISVINANGKRLQLGTFDTKEEAVQIRVQAEKFYYGGDESLSYIFDNLKEKKKRKSSATLDIYPHTLIKHDH